MLCLVNFEKPLSNSIRLEGEAETVIQVHYPWLPSRCNLCHHWGHSEKVCDQNRADTCTTRVTDEFLSDNKPMGDPSPKTNSSPTAEEGGTVNMEEVAQPETAKGKAEFAELKATSEAETETEEGWSVVQRNGNHLHQFHHRNKAPVLMINPQKFLHHASTF